LGQDVKVSRVKIWNGNEPYRLSNSIVSLIDSKGYTMSSYRIGDATGISIFEFVTPDFVDPGGVCDQLLQQFHRVDENLSIQGKWQGGSVTGICKGWGTNKVRSIVLAVRLGDHRMKCSHAALLLCI
jgi:hypothetical protein